MKSMSDGFDLNAYMREKKELVDSALMRNLHRCQDRRHRNTILFDAMHYSLEAGGKRIRPVLCLAACEAVGGDQKDAMNAACALEFIHTYSLIHDDLPAMDDDDFRRGKPTCHKVFGEATAILAGDALLTKAFEVLTFGDSKRIDPADQLRVIQVVADAAGPSGMVQGQMLDLFLEGKQVTWNEAQHMHELKTGALLKVSLEIGAIIGGGNPAEVSALCSYGQNIGLAFQLADDILNVEGDSEVLGKPVGSDEILKKASAPAILGLDVTREYATRLVDAALSELKILWDRSTPLIALAHYVIEREK